MYHFNCNHLFQISKYNNQPQHENHWWFERIILIISPHWNSSKKPWFLTLIWRPLDTNYPPQHPCICSRAGNSAMSQYQILVSQLLLGKIWYHDYWYYEGNILHFLHLMFYSHFLFVYFYFRNIIFGPANKKTVYLYWETEKKKKEIYIHTLICCCLWGCERDVKASQKNW